MLKACGVRLENRKVVRTPGLWPNFLSILIVRSINNTICLLC